MLYFYLYGPLRNQISILINYFYHGLDKLDWAKVIFYTTD